MKLTHLIFSLLFMGCATSVKLTDVKIHPGSRSSEKIVYIKAEVRNAYQFSCIQDGALFQLQDGHWKEIEYKFDPNDSGTPFILDGEFFQNTTWGEGCDVILCKKAFPGISFHLVEYKEIGEKPNPEYKGKVEENGWPIPKNIPEFQSNYLSGRFKARYDYYTDSECKNIKHQEIEFEVH